MVTRERARGGRAAADAEGTLCYGINAVAAVLTHRPRQIKQALALNSCVPTPRVVALIMRLNALGVEILEVERHVLDEMCEGGAHQGIALRLKPEKRRAEGALESMLESLDATAPLVLLALDGVTDPHNLGAALRCAAGAGAQALIVPRDKAAPLNGAALKAAAGAASFLPLFTVTNLSRVLRRLREAYGFEVAGLDAHEAQSLYEYSCPPRLVLVAGSEGEGLRRLTRESCDILLKIPLNAQMESLNVAVASALALFEYRRQHPLPTDGLAAEKAY